MSYRQEDQNKRESMITFCLALMEQEFLEVDVSIGVKRLRKTV